MAESAAHADANAGRAATMSGPETGAAAVVRSCWVRYAAAQRFAPPRSGATSLIPAKSPPHSPEGFRCNGIRSVPAADEPVCWH